MLDRGPTEVDAANVRALQQEIVEVERSERILQQRLGRYQADLFKEEDLFDEDLASAQDEEEIDSDT